MRDSRCADHQRTGWVSDQRRGSRHQRGYGAAWKRSRERVLIRDGRLCQPCKRRGVLTPDCNEVDHVVPKAEGGTDADANLQTICKDCHKRKTQQESRRGIGGRKV
ncbi:MAG TPA: HNH endonuclease signature motif containing protein [Acidimicrobiia bacterium]